MKLTARWKGQEAQIEVDENGTLNDLKTATASVFKVDPSQVRVVFHSQILKGNDKLSKYKIFDNSLVNVIISNVFVFLLVRLKVEVLLLSHQLQLPSLDLKLATLRLFVRNISEKKDFMELL